MEKVEFSKKHKSYNIQFKLSAIKLAEKIGNRPAARSLQFDERRLREWRQQKNELNICAKRKLVGGEEKSRKRLSGGGRKILSPLLDEIIFNWILNCKENGVRVSRRSIQEKALELYPAIGNSSSTNFTASNGWLEKFMSRKQLSIRSKSSIVRKDLKDLEMKIANYIIHINEVRKKDQIYSLKSIVAMDETAIYFDTLSNTEVDPISTDSMNHEKMHATVVLAAKADGTKLKPFVVFKEEMREMKRSEYSEISDAIVRNSSNGWMNQKLIVDWLESVFDTISLTDSQQMLVWDSYKCHISRNTIDKLKELNVTSVIIPSGCTRYIQVSNVSWNKPFKEKLTKFYDAWMSGSENKEYTTCGYVKAPARKLVVQWIIDAWKSLSNYLVKESFKSCALSICPEGNDDSLINCIKAGEVCEGAANLLFQFRTEQIYEKPIVEEDLEEEENNEILIDNDHDGIEPTTSIEYYHMD